MSVLGSRVTHVCFQLMCQVSELYNESDLLIGVRECPGPLCQFVEVCTLGRVHASSHGVCSCASMGSASHTCLVFWARPHVGQHIVTSLSRSGCIVRAHGSKIRSCHCRALCLHSIYVALYACDESSTLCDV